MTGVRYDTAILVDPDVRGVGIDLDALVSTLKGLGTGRTVLVPGLARHPELLTGAVKASRARRAVVVTAELECPPVAELRTWGAAGGLAPLGVQVVALDILRARRSTTERSAYAVRMVRAAVAAPGTAVAARRSVGASLSRRGLLTGRATTWVPVIEVEARACVGTLRCGRCVEACPEDALQIQDDVLGAPPVVDASRCQACSGCLDVCPSGALSLDGHDPGTLGQQLRALCQRGDGAAAPALVISCQSAAEPLHRLGERDGLPGWLVLELACLGGVGSAWHLAALAAGARTVQLLPCERCLDRGSLTSELSFTRDLLAALGDVDATRRVGVLPAGGSRLKRAVLAADRLTALVDGTGADQMPAPRAVDTSARVAAWAVGELQVGLGSAGQDRHLLPQMIQGQGSPLGVLRAADGCTACGVCARICPTRALSLGAGVGSTELVLDPAACTGCGVCIETCPEDVLEVVPGVDLDLLAGGCVPLARVAAAACPDCGESVPALPAAALLTALPTELASRCPRCRQTALVAST
ncbi:MAG: 4Fe-4S binding protein [Dermatophilaceae bacterium]